MQKVKITANGLLNVIKSVLSTDEIDVRIIDGEYAGKRVQEILNVEYYAFKHRPVKSEQVIFNIVQQGGNADTLQSIKRSFCLFSLDDTTRLPAKDIDYATITGTLEYHIQTSKVPFLEELIENFNLELGSNGKRVPIQFGEQTRKGYIVLDRPRVLDIQSTSLFGEIQVIEVGVAIILSPDVATYSDYTVSFSFTNSNGEYVQNVELPLTSFSFVNTMTQKSLPQERQNYNIANINLSKGLSFSLTFDGYNNAFIDYLNEQSLSAGENNINSPIIMKVSKGDKQYIHNVIIKDHQVSIKNDTSNENHILTLVTQFTSLRRELFSSTGVGK